MRLFKSLRNRGKADGERPMPKVKATPQRPRFLCIGAAKAGTSWFHKMFGQHPDVWMTLLKETHYFDGRFGEAVKVPARAIRKRTTARAEQAARRSGPLSANAVYWEALTRQIWTPEWYENAFTHPDAMGRVCGESTPAYCALPNDGIRAIWEELPGIRLIHFIRDPVARMLSGMQMDASMKGYSPDDPPEPEWWEKRAFAKGMLARGDYADQIPRWHAVFPAERILYVPFGDLKTDPLGVLRRIEKHLDLPAAQYDVPKISKPVHVGTRYHVPTPVKDALEERLAPQWAFLMDHFPQEFCKRLS